MKPDKAPAYWPTRIMLACAIVVVAVDCAVAPLLIWPPEMMGGDHSELFGFPATLVVGVSALGMGLGGLIWMVRIFGGPRDEPPPWRYRDR